MLKNGNFADRWTDMEPTDFWLINQEPEGWRLRWLDPGTPLYDDPHNKAEGIPECVHKLSRQLPPNEQRGARDALILEGDAVYKIFHAQSPFGASLTQTVTGLQPGTEATLTVPIQVHRHGDSDAYGAESGVWINGQGGWVNSEIMGDRRWYRHVQTITVPDDGRAEIVILVKSKWFSPKDFFVDGIKLEAQTGEPAIDNDAPADDELPKRKMFIRLPEGVSVEHATAANWKKKIKITTPADVELIVE